jgi:hypothetical protein
MEDLITMRTIPNNYGPYKRLEDNGNNIRLLRIVPDESDISVFGQPKLKPN